MPRTLYFTTACLLALLFCAPGRAQDSPSLGDLARQAQKNKTSAPAKKVLTNDDISSGSPSGAGLASSGLGAIAPPASTGANGNRDAGSSAEQAVGRMESVILMLDSMNRADLVRGALQGVDTDFPGRSNWETRLFAAKQLYVSRGRDLLLRVKQIQASAEALQGSHDPNDPRVKDLTVQMQGLVRDGTRMDAAFQAVILEGRDLATQAQAH
ncbi:MAG: hypothetical protein LAO08_01135 [Acidobacteriia bacterium]|nr:hypothetical protein [Terriglobia bacterium]